MTFIMEVCDDIVCYKLCESIVFTCDVQHNFFFWSKDVVSITIYFHATRLSLLKIVSILDIIFIIN
jgi:hypothetical protein